MNEDEARQLLEEIKDAWKGGTLVVLRPYVKNKKLTVGKGYEILDLEHSPDLIKALFCDDSRRACWYTIYRPGWTYPRYQFAKDPTVKPKYTIGLRVWYRARFLRYEGDIQEIRQKNTVFSYYVNEVWVLEESLLPVDE